MSQPTHAPLQLVLCIIVTLFSVCVAHTAPPRVSVPKLIDETYSQALKALGTPKAELGRVVDRVLQQKFSLLEDSHNNKKEAARIRLLRFVTLASGWASIRSLDDLVHQLSLNKHTVAVDGKGATLGDFLLYLADKGHFKHSPSVLALDEAGDVETAAAGSGKPVKLLLDSMMLRRLQDVAAFREAVAQDGSDVTFIVPFGYEAINMFNTRFLEQRIAMLYDLIAAAELTEKFASPNEEAKWMRESLKALVLKELPAISGFEYSWKIEFVLPASFRFLLLQNDDDDKKLQEFFRLDAAQLVDKYLARNFQTPLAKSSWQNIFTLYKNHRQTQREIGEALRSGLFCSFEMLGELSHTIFTALDKRKPLQNTMNDMQFMIPVARKSFGVATMIFFLNHPHLSTANLVKYAPDDENNGVVWARRCTKPFCVLLDDFAGSGASLVARAQDIRVASAKKNSRPSVVVAPLVQTETAPRLFSAYKFAVVAGFDLGPRVMYSHWMGGRGFAGGTYFISFPYTSPDNNVGFMAYIVAPLLLFNGLGAKISSDSGTIGPPPRLFTYTLLRRRELTSRFWARALGRSDQEYWE
eukprot:gnl/Spiro4/21888_TR10737_c0_g1_i1.p1 gnl/Spiro4/21888_TR10737_c0_g1~~gnl/Spiro4/21888_TR10737_c0_g1_i1.p1  ORF type:complete len:583 (+),score=137.51 gnl/Spiro4/21888_TR10737_c0_g1_i1:246-1994(+)